MSFVNQLVRMLRGGSPDASVVFRCPEVANDEYRYDPDSEDGLQVSLDGAWCQSGYSIGFVVQLGPSRCLDEHCDVAECQLVRAYFAAGGT